MEIRRMTVDDLSTVREIDAHAFNRKDDGSLLLRSMENLTASLALNPAGCFVAVDDGGKLLGYTFSRLWGHWGWIGTFGIAPDHQHEGIGRQLLDATVQYLRGLDCMGIGLEVLPDNSSALSLYTAYGFRTMHPTFTMVKALDPDASHGADHLTSVREASSLDVFRAIGRKGMPGHDYTNEAVNALSFGWGDVLVLKTQEPMAGVIIRKQSKFETVPAPTGTLVVQSLAATPDGRSALRGVLSSLESYAIKRNFSAISLSINSVDAESARWLINYGFRVQSTTVRMMIVGEYPCPPGLDMSCWLM